MQKYTFKEHFLELKRRFLVTIFFFLSAFITCYYFSDNIYNFTLKPLASVVSEESRKMIYTGMAEAFFTYIKLSFWVAFLIIIPVVSYQLYCFIAPGLLKNEKNIVLLALVAAPILFYLGGFFVFHFVMPAAWQFFLSFENTNSLLPIVLEARISEYLSLVMQLVTAFGLAAQLPIIMLILCVLGIINAESLKKKRRLAIVIIFIVAAIITPPDVLSQIALAMPLVLLYELSIIICKFVEKRDR